MTFTSHFAPEEQHFFSPYIESEVNHKRYFIKIPFINKGIEFLIYIVSRHVFKCFLLHYAVFCLANVNINTLPYFYGSEKSVFPKNACSDFSRFILSRIFTSDPKPDGSKWRLSLIHCYCVSCHSSSAFWRNIWLHTNMIGRLFNLHIVKSTPNSQTWKRQSFMIFILTLTSHFTLHMFSSWRVKCSVKMTFWYFITGYKYSIRIF